MQASVKLFILSSVAAHRIANVSDFRPKSAIDAVGVDWRQ